MTTLAQLRDAVTAAEREHTVARRAAFLQREVVEQAKNADILARGSAGIPRPRGDPARKSETELALIRARATAEVLEGRRADAEAALNRARSELLTRENEILSARREQLAGKVIGKTGAGADASAAFAMLRALCPDERYVRLSQRFTLSPLVQHALRLGAGAVSDIDTPCNELALGADSGGWDEARARVLAEAEENDPDGSFVARTGPEPPARFVD